MHTRLMGTVLLLSLALTFRAWAGWDEWVAAYNRGDYATAVRELLLLAQGGNATAQVNLGLMYYNGQGVPQDYAQAIQWFRRAADQGHADAQVNLGVMYHDGHGVLQDYALAIQWFRRAADQGDANAQTHLGGMYANGRGVPQDYTQAMQCYRKAADQGNADAQSRLAYMYAIGQSVPQDYALAFQWFRRAADQGDANAQLNLGWMYAAGQGVPQDFQQAYFWYSLAAAQGPQNWNPTTDHEKSVRNRDRLAALLTPTQLAQAQARAWQPHQEHPQVRVEPAPRTAAPPHMVQPTPVTEREEIPLESKGGVYALPVQINGVLTLHFILDTGAAEVNIPADVALTLLRTGTIKNPNDFLPGVAYTLADGTTVKSFRFTIRSLTLGSRHITNVPASIGTVASPLLLGQSFLKRLGM